jgi:splicing factor 3B subunit 3
VDHPPLALACFQKRLLVGMGNLLRIYDLGKRKLLRKCENKNFPTTIQSIHVMADRIYVADMCESFFLVKYNKTEKTLNIWADTNTPRYITSSVVVDYDTIAAGDKFGNLFVARLPPGVTEDIETDPSGGKSALLDPYNNALNQVPHKLVDICQYHVGEIITSIQKVSLVTGGSEVLFYSTIMGGMGIMVPFSSREDLEFFTHLEMHLRQESPPLCGRDHLAYRSYYFPVKDTVDGDLCEQFTSLPWERQAAIAEELVRVPSEVTKKLEEVRNRVL